MGGNIRGKTRRGVLAGATAALAATAGCLSGVVRSLGFSGHDTVVVDVDADGIVWSGDVTFSKRDGTRVTIPVDDVLGSRSYTLPDDIDADGYDTIYEPLTVTARPHRGVDAGEPLSVVVRCDGETCGRASTTDVEEPARVEVD